MKKWFFISILLFLFGCDNQYDILNQHPQEKAIPIDRSEFMQNVMDTIQLENSEIIITNPYKNKGLLKLKGSMHNHSNNSLAVEGFASGAPDATAVKFRDQAGYDFYTFTDHNYVTEDPGVTGIVWMGRSVEDTKNTQHLNIYNLPAGYKYVNVGDNIQKLIDHYRDLGAIVCYNHPGWAPQVQSDSKIVSVVDLDFVEVINSISGVDERAFDLLLSKGFPVFGFAVDDYHNNSAWGDPNRYFNKAYVIAFAEKKERSSIWKALLSGCFYATQGAEMDIRCDKGMIMVSSNKQSTFEFIGLNVQSPGGGTVLSTSTNVQEASYRIEGNEGYVRVRVVNSDGAAYSQSFVIQSILNK